MKLSIIIKKELIDQIRDKRTLIAAVLMPAVIVPLLLFLMIQNTANEELNGSVRIVIQKDEIQLRNLILESFKDTEFVISDDPAGTIKNGEAELGINSTESGGRYKTVVFYYDSARRVSVLAYVKIYGLLKSYLGKSETAAEGPVVSSLTVRDEKESKTLLTLSVILPVFLIVFAASSAMSSVIDMSAGEKERSTIETLISCNISRGTIILGKILAASAIGITAVLSLLSGLIICSELFPRITGGISLLEFSGLKNIVVMLLTASLSVFLFSAAGMAIGLYAKSVKEGTILTLPLIVVSSAVSSGLIGGDPFNINALYFLVPVLNLSLVIRSILYSRLNEVALMISVPVNLAYAALFFIISGHLMKRETVISRS